MKAFRQVRCRVAKIVLIPFLALFLTLTAAAAPGGKHKDLHIVAVGITSVPGQNEILSCKKDAEDMIHWAHSQKGKLYDDVHASAPVLNTKATKANVLKAVHAMARRAGPEDTSILYLSSHGSCSSGQWHFLAYDGGITWSEFKSAMIGIKGTVVVLIDACQSGGVQAQNMIVFSASLQSQNTGAGNATQNSEFTAYVLAGLEGKADFDRDGYVTRSELEAYVANQVRKAHGRRQNITVSVPANTPSDLPLAKLTATVSLAGKSFSGTEMLGAPYGKLGFEFKPDGKLSVLAGGKTFRGTYTQTGDEVTILVTGVGRYEGNISGSGFSGRGIDALHAWSFRVETK